MGVLVDELVPSRYLLQTYSGASRQWSNFQQSQDDKQLRGTARALCKGLQRLNEDIAFWAQLHTLTGTFEEHWSDIEATLASIESLLVIEEEVLVNPSDPDLTPVQASRLVGDMALAIDIVRERPDARSIENLRGRTAGLRDAVCQINRELPMAYSAQVEEDEARLQIPGMEAGPPTKDVNRLRRRRFFRAVRIVGKAVAFVAGGAIVVGNLTATGVGQVPALASAAGGLSLMTKALD